MTDRPRSYRFRDGTPPPRRPRSNDFGGRQEKRLRGVPMPADWRIPPPYDDYDHSAIRAVAAGIATSEQAKHALDYILFIARAYENPFHSDSKIHAYLAGRRSVAVDIIKLINMKIKGQDESEHG